VRCIIESLAPDSRRFYWRWVVGVFSLYVLLLVGAAGAFISHESSRKLAHEDAATVAGDRSLARSHEASMPARQTARYY
jgi:hypothetical protein